MRGQTTSCEDRTVEWPAITVALVLILGFGVGYRRLAAHYSRPADSVPIPPGTLAKLPLEIDGWLGREQPMDEAVVEATDTDDHVSRIYRRRTGQVSLYVAYGVRLRDLAPHRPDVCYPAAGWSLESTETLSVPLGDAEPLPCRIHRFRRGGLVSSRVTVLSYYIVDDTWYGDVSELRSRQAEFKQGRSYAAQVQVVCGSGEVEVERNSRRLVTDFAEASAPLIRDLLVAAVSEAISAEQAADEPS